MKKFSTTFITCFSIIVTIMLSSGLSVYPAIVQGKAPVIIFVKSPSKVAAGISFTVRVGIASESSISYINVTFDGVVKKVVPKTSDRKTYSFDLVAKTPGRKVLRVYAVDIKNFSGKQNNKVIYVYGGVSNGIYETEIPTDNGKRETEFQRLSDAPPRFSVEKEEYCCNGRIELRGEFPGDDFSARLGVRKLKIIRVSKNQMSLTAPGFSVEDYLYVKNIAGETRSERKISVRCRPKILSFSPPQTGQKEKLEIRGVDLKNVKQIKLFVKRPWSDRIYYPEINGKAKSNTLNVIMPDILNYPGPATMQLISECGSSNKIELSIKEEGVTWLVPKITDFSPTAAAPGSEVKVYVARLSLPEKERVDVSFNNLSGNVKKITYVAGYGFEIDVEIPEDLNNIVDYNQKIIVTSSGKTSLSKEDFFLFGKPVIDKIEIAEWSGKYIEIKGKNFAKKSTMVYFSGFNGKWIEAEEVFYMGFGKVQAKIPINVVKGPVKVETSVNGVIQKCISGDPYDPGTGK